MLHHDADDLLGRLDRVTPSDGDEMRLVYRERGWIEALQHLAEKGMLTAAGESEAAKLIAASNEWVDGLASDELVMPPAPADDLGDEPVIVPGP